MFSEYALLTGGEPEPVAETEAEVADVALEPDGIGFVMTADGIDGALELGAAAVVAAVGTGVALDAFGAALDEACVATLVVGAAPDIESGGAAVLGALAALPVGSGNALASSRPAGVLHAHAHAAALASKETEVTRSRA